MKSAKLLGGLALLTPVSLAGANDRPNIIFFLVDDNGYVDSQVPYGYEVYPNNNRFDTPNMLKLASEHPEKVAELAKILSDKLRGWNATMPIDRTTGKPVPMPDEVLGL